MMMSNLKKSQSLFQQISEEVNGSSSSPNQDFIKQASQLSESLKKMTTSSGRDKEMVKQAANVMSALIQEVEKLHEKFAFREECEKVAKQMVDDGRIYSFDFPEKLAELIESGKDNLELTKIAMKLNESKGIDKNANASFGGFGGPVNSKEHKYGRSGGMFDSVM